VTVGAARCALRSKGGAQQLRQVLKRRHDGAGADVGAARRRRWPSEGDVPVADGVRKLDPFEKAVGRKKSIRGAMTQHTV